MARVNDGSHRFTCHLRVYPQVAWTIPAALSLALISRPAEGRRLSWPRWLGEILRWFARPKTVTHPSICRGCRELNLRPSTFCRRINLNIFWFYHNHVSFLDPYFVFILTIKKCAAVQNDTVLEHFGKSQQIVFTVFTDLWLSRLPLFTTCYTAIFKHRPQIKSTFRRLMAALQNEGPHPPGRLLLRAIFSLP